ncbi:hypothetical protein C453_05289 [Haloferax elongans ATCC BAA-1513]|uniref:Uncharacterized protein n=1 Tax=Haloferax elongans ATCC BAA-1513 TaxID=1230453 RepID=M0HX93_HALEO|nr:hypothetical protein C453_05289 [Haloferax elongans ATCC BAA-1513]
MNSQEKRDYLSARNGFVTAAVLLAVITVYQLLTQGAYASETFVVLLLSVAAFWGTKLVHTQQE